MKVADLSGDVRLRNPADYEQWYGSAPLFPDCWTGRSTAFGTVPGQAEGSGTWPAVWGATPPAPSSACTPWPGHGLIGDVRIEVLVGSSEAGATPTTGSHHPFRSRALRVYEPFRHRHLAEILQELNLSEEGVTLTMTAVEMIRGSR